MTGRPRPRVALFAAPETSPAILFGLYDVLSTVGAVYPDMTTGRAGDALLDLSIVAADRRTVSLLRQHAGRAERVDRRRRQRYDVIIVCDLYTPITTAPRGRFAREAAWLRADARGGALIASVCTGSLLVAEAGLLDGRPAPDIGRTPICSVRSTRAVTFDASAILVLATETDGVITAGGVTAWQDLALHVIARLCGPEHAIRTAKVHLLAGHQDGQLPYAAMVKRKDPNDAAIVRSQAWIADNYAGRQPGRRDGRALGPAAANVRSPISGSDGPAANGVCP